MNKADRKKQLIAQGAIHRVEVLLAKRTVQARLHPDMLARKALPGIALSALSLFKRRAGSGASLWAFLPLLSGIAARMKGKSLFRPLVRSILVAGTVAGVAAIFAQSKKTDT